MVPRAKNLRLPISGSVVVVVVCYCTPTLGTSSAHSTLSRLVVHLEPKKESVWSEESHPSSSLGLVLTFPPLSPASRIGPAACSTARSATTCVASRRVAAAYGVAHLALRTPFYVQNHDARSASTVVLAAATQPTTAVSRPWTRYTRVGTLEHRGSTFGKPAKVHRWWWTCNKRNHRTMTMTLLYRVSLDRKSRQHPSAPSRAAPGATSRPRTSMTLVTMRRRLSPGQTLRHWCQSTLGHFRHLRH